MRTTEERELLKRIRQDPAAFGLLYDAYFAPIFGYVFRRMGLYDLAKDITAESFLKAYQKIDLFEWRNISISSWLYKIAGNEVNQYFRKSKYRPACLDDLRLDKQLSYHAGIETEKAALEKALLEHQEFLELHKELKKLDTKYQEVIALRYFEEKSIREMAEILGKNEGTVKSLLSRGLGKLRSALEKK